MLCALGLVVLMLVAGVSESRAVEGGWVNTTPQVDASLRTVDFADAGHAWAGGVSLWDLNTAGILLSSSNGGSTWSTLYGFPYDYWAQEGWTGGLTSIARLSTSHAYVTLGGAYETTDGGLSWASCIPYTLDGGAPI